MDRAFSAIMLALALAASAATASWVPPYAPHPYPAAGAYAPFPAAAPPMVPLGAPVAHAGCICTREYSPKCCYNKGGFYTTPNPCLCEKSGGILFASGECADWTKPLQIPFPGC